MNEKAMAAYRDLLWEIKYRVEVIDQVREGVINIRKQLAEEFCYLQLRMICETIAIGCLIIHEDISASKTDLMKAYKADWIIAQMARLHPKFYPRPLEAQDDTGSEVPAWVERKEGFLMQQELPLLWHKHAGGKLHRGSLRSVMAGKQKQDFDAIWTWRNKIVALLNRHTIISPDEENIVYAIMNDGEGNVHSALFSRVDRQP